MSRASWMLPPCPRDSSPEIVGPAGNLHPMEFVQRRVRDRGFTVYVPGGFEPRRTPGILFLHGRGESGTDNVRPSQHGLPLAIRIAPEQWPCLVVVPQKMD